MSLQLSPKSQRLRSRKAEVTHQLIVFRVQQEWFALPIQVAQKVIPLGNLYGGGAGSDVSLTLYQDREIPVVDIQQRIFGTKPTPLLPGQAASEHPSRSANPSSPVPKTSNTPLLPDRFLLLIQSDTNATIGFPIDAQPMLRRVNEAAFVPLSETYLTGGQVRCVTCLVVPAPDQPPIFLLNLDQLLQAQPTLLESEKRALPG
ncbi:MAG: hypothetical protein ACAF41_15030 [Leptolyngbya sp. BL-A-14]